MIKSKNYIYILIIIILTISVYAVSVNNEFVNWDDTGMIVNNTSIRSLDLNNIKKIFTPHLGSSYQPLRTFSSAIDYALCELNPVCYHIHSILLHILASIFLFLSLMNALPLLTTKSKVQNSHPSPIFQFPLFIAFFTALLFAVHPVNVEAVTWLSDRKYPLLSFFSFLSFYFYTSMPIKKKSILLYIGTLISAILAVLSSPFGIVLPGFFFLYDYCRNSSNNPFTVLKKHIWHYLPFIIAFAVLFTILFFATMKGGAGGVLHGHYQNNPFNTFFTMFRVFFDYLKNLICPLWLSARYIDYISTSFFQFKIIASLFILIIVTFFAVWNAVKKQKFILFCLGWYLLFLFPASNILPISIKMADRYLYIASPGFFLLFSFYLQKFLAFIQLKVLKTNTILNKILLNSTPVILILILSFLTVKQNIIWSNSITLWTNAIESDNRNYFALDKLASALTDKDRYPEAIYYYTQSLKIHPEYITTYINFGKALTATGQMEKAVTLYNKGLQLWQDNAKLHNNLGNALGQLGRYKEAIKHFLLALKKSNGYKEAHSNLGYYYGLNGNFKKGIIHCRKAIVIDPTFAEAYNNLGMLFALQNKNAEAILQYKKALSINPKLATAYYNIGCAAAGLGKLNEAIDYFQQALNIKPDYRAALINRQKLLKYID